MEEDGGGVAAVAALSIIRVSRFQINVTLHLRTGSTIFLPGEFNTRTSCASTTDDCINDKNENLLYFFSSSTNDKKKKKKKKQIANIKLSFSPSPSILFQRFFNNNSTRMFNGSSFSL